ncbi:hypothetical protein GQ457_01G045600 [Hibiscus cannabinus]
MQVALQYIFCGWGLVRKENNSFKKSHPFTETQSSKQGSKTLCKLNQIKFLLIRCFCASDRLGIWILAKGAFGGSSSFCFSSLLWS